MSTQKKWASLFFAGAVLWAGAIFALTISPAFAEFSNNTAQVPATATISAEVTDGNAIITWTDPLKVVRVQHYIGHGKKGGVIKDIAVGAEKQVILGDIEKNGGRFNFVTEGGQFLHIECGGNDETTEPTLKGRMVKDKERMCDYIDPKSGEKVGALVVE